MSSRNSSLGANNIFQDVMQHSVGIVEAMRSCLMPNCDMIHDWHETKYSRIALERRFMGPGKKRR